MSSWSLPIHNDSLLAPKSAITIGKSNLFKGREEIMSQKCRSYSIFTYFMQTKIIDHCECIALGTHDY